MGEAQSIALNLDGFWPQIRFKAQNQQGIFNRVSGNCISPSSFSNPTQNRFIDFQTIDVTLIHNAVAQRVTSLISVVLEQ